MLKEVTNIPGLPKHTVGVVTEQCEDCGDKAVAWITWDLCNWAYKACGKHVRYWKELADTPHFRVVYLNPVPDVEAEAWDE